MKNKLKNTIQESSYTKIYLFVGAVVIAILGFFFWNSQRSDVGSYYINDQKTKQISTVTTENTDAKTEANSESTDASNENTNTTDTTVTNPSDNANQGEPTYSVDGNTTVDNNVKVQEPVKTPEVVAPTTNTTVVAPEVKPSTNVGLIQNGQEIRKDGVKLDVNFLPAEYQVLDTKAFVIKKGDSISSILKKNGANMGNFYAMYALDKKSFDTLNIGDKLYYKEDSKGRLVYLSLYKKDDNYLGSFYYDQESNKYKYVK